MSNSLRVNYSSSDESRPQSDVLFPFVDILQGGTAYISFGSEPFTPNNELRYNTFEVKNDFTKFSDQARADRSAAASSATTRTTCSSTAASRAPGSTTASTTSTPTRATALANPNRTTSPVTARRYQVRYMNIPGLDKPSQPLTALYGGAYAQDVWRPRSNLSVTAGPALRRAGRSRTPPTTTPTPTR